MLERLKSLPLTILLTILIWMYAEAQFTSSRSDVRVNVQVSSPSPDLALRIYDLDRNATELNPVLNLIITLSGPQNQIERIYQDSLKLQPDESVEGLAYIPSANELKQAGDKGLTIETLPMLNNLEYFRTRGVTVTSASPARLRLEVSPVVDLSVAEIPVFVSGSPDLLKKFDADIEPRMITVRVAGSRGRIDALAEKVKTGGGKASGIVAYIDLPVDARTGILIARRLRYVLPDGLTQVSGPTEATYRLIERPTTTTAP